MPPISALIEFESAAGVRWWLDCGHLRAFPAKRFQVQWRWGAVYAPGLSTSAIALAGDLPLPCDWLSPWPLAHESGRIALAGRALALERQEAPEPVLAVQGVGSGLVRRAERK